MLQAAPSTSPGTSKQPLGLPWAREVKGSFPALDQHKLQQRKCLSRVISSPSPCTDSFIAHRKQPNESQPISPLPVHGWDFWGRKVPVSDSPPHLGSTISKGWVRRRFEGFIQGPQHPSAPAGSFVTRDSGHGLTASTHGHRQPLVSHLVHQGKACPFASHLGSTQDKRFQFDVFSTGPTQAHDDLQHYKPTMTFLTMELCNKPGLPPKSPQ